MGSSCVSSGVAWGALGASAATTFSAGDAGGGAAGPHPTKTSIDDAESSSKENEARMTHDGSGELPAAGAGNR